MHLLRGKFCNDIGINAVLRRERFGRTVYGKHKAMYTTALTVPASETEQALTVRPTFSARADAVKSPLMSQPRLRR